MPTTKRETAKTAATHDRLRALLLEHFPHEPVNRLASALAYELASVIATAAPTNNAAIATLLSFTEVSIEQIHRLGVGRPHP